MNFKELKYKINNKFFKYLIIISLIFLILIFVSFKNEFFFTTINYMTNYIDYYITKYLNGNIKDLIVDNKVLIYIESDVANIFSSLYIYVVTFGSKLFKIYTLVMPLLIFHWISSSLHDELYNNFMIPKIVRIGISKYIKNTIFVNSVCSGLIYFIPRLIYLLILFIFFPVGVSNIHFITDSSFITQPFLYVAYNASPVILIIIDLIISFIYGMILSFISIIVTSLIKNKSLSYLIYIFVLGTLSIVPLFFSQTPFIFYNSLFNYFDQLSTMNKTFNVYCPLLIIIIFSLICFIMTLTIFIKKVEKNI